MQYIHPWREEKDKKLKSFDKFPKNLFLYNCWREEKGRQLAEGKLGELLHAADRTLVEQAAMEKQVKTFLLQEQVSRSQI